MVHPLDLMRVLLRVAGVVVSTTGKQMFAGWEAVVVGVGCSGVLGGNCLRVSDRACERAL